MTKRTRKRKEETSNEIWEAINLIESGNANLLDNPSSKELTIKNVCIQANVSRPTLYSYPDIKQYISDAKKPSSLEAEYKARVIELEAQNIELKDYIEQLEKERNLALLEQYNALELLKNKNNILKLN